MNSKRDPLDPASWEGYDVPAAGGWGRGLDHAQGRSGAPRPAAAATAAGAGAPHRSGGPLPSPGDIMRMNKGA